MSKSCSPTLVSGNGPVAYIFDPEIASMELGEGYYMRPFRLLLTHELVTCLGLLDNLSLYTATPADVEDLTKYHTAEYVLFLRYAELYMRPEDHDERNKYQVQFEYDLPEGSRADCPLFQGLWEYVARYSGATLAATRLLLEGSHRVAITWSGGMHHGRRGAASGFCYVNDIVLAIVALKEKYDRVMYIDIDVHHGDGVEAAFRDDPRVLTLSLHQFEHNFYPGTGSLESSRGTSVNIPLSRGTSDDAYAPLFRTALCETVSAFDPTAIVLQCGADAITGDKLGDLNLSTAIHCQCVAAVLNFGVPTLLLGGGGYNITHTARCWALNTATACGVDIASLPRYIPCNKYSEVFEKNRGPCPLQVTAKPMSTGFDITQVGRVTAFVMKQMIALRSLRFGLTRSLSDHHPMISRGPPYDYTADRSDSRDVMTMQCPNSIYPQSTEAVTVPNIILVEPGNSTSSEKRRKLK